jgi:D-3-phosphoglycerate dehydrogenase
LLEGIDPSAVEAFHEEGFGSVESLSHALAGDALRDVLQRAHMLGIRSGTRLPAEVLQAAAHLMAVGCFCIGTNQVDLAAAMRLGIPVFNAPFSNTRSVAELVLAHTIYLLRGIPQRNADLHRGLWVKSSANAHEARGKTLGLVGYGHIGSQVGVLAEQLGMVVLFYDPEARLPFGNARSMSSLDALLTQADVVSLHVPEAPGTTGLIGGHQLAAMRVGSSLINASRGSVVDIAALHDALQQGHLQGAALDVFPSEPRADDTAFASPLRTLDQVVLTPHIGGSTREAQINIGREVAAKLLRYAVNGSTVSAVNFPELALPVLKAGQRLLHTHHNTPGVLAGLNAQLSRQGINIEGQYLGTNSDIGYVAIDIGATPALPAPDDFFSPDHTLRCRLVDAQHPA